MAVSVFVIANDMTALSVALPQIEKDFDADVTTVQWVINAYALVFGVLIVTGGRLADMFGRRRVFFVGAAIFAALLAARRRRPGRALADRLPGADGHRRGDDVAGRARHDLRHPARRPGRARGRADHRLGRLRQRRRAAARRRPDRRAELALDPVREPADRGAGLLRHLAQRAPRAAAPGPSEGIDVPGVATLSVGLVALLLALDQVTDWGWTDPRILGLFAACAVLLAAFVVIERRAGERALIPRDVMANRGFRAACLATLLMSAIFFAALLYLPQFMQKILGWDPLEAGAGLLPMMGVFAVHLVRRRAALRALRGEARRQRRGRLPGGGHRS